MLSTQDIDPMRNGRGRGFFLFRWVAGAWHWLFPPTLADQDRQSNTARIVARILLVALGLGILTLGIVYARPIHDRWQSWQADRTIAKAESLLEGGDMVKAFMLAQDAYKLDPEHVPTLRMLGRLLTAVGKNQAPFFWEKLRKMGVSTLEDEIGYVQSLLKLNRTTEASDYLADLIDQHPANARLIKVAEEVWGAGKANERVLPKLKAYASEPGADRATRLNTILLQLASEDEVERAAGRASLLVLAEGEDETALLALRQLSIRDDLTSDERRHIIERLLEHPEAKEEDRVTAFHHRVLLDPLNREKLIEAELVRTRDFERDDLFPISRWLLQNGESGRLLAILDPEKIKTHEGLVMTYMTALTNLGRISELERLVDDPETRLSRSMRAFQKAHLDFIKGVTGGGLDVTRLRDQLGRVKDAAIVERRSDVLTRLAEYAEQRNLHDLAADVFRYSALNMAKGERIAFAGWLRNALKMGDTASYAAAAREASRRWPDDQAFAENVIYADLLVGERVETQLKRATQLLELRPENSVRKLIVALGFWRIGDPASAVKNLMHIKLDDVSQGQRAIFAALARGSGFPKEADLVEKSIPSSAGMLPEEREALARSKQ